MNKIKNIFKTPMLVVFVIICLTLLPNAVNMESAVFRSAIVVGFGMDYNEQNGYEIHAAINVSAKDESLSENTKLVSATGGSVSEAISHLSVQFGRSIKFGHTRYLLIGRKLAEQNLAVIIDGIIRTNKMRDTVQLVLCNSGIVEMLNAGIEIKNKTGIKLSDIITYKSKFSTVAMDSNVDTFYKGYFSNSGISKISCVSLTDDYTKGITPEAALGNATSPAAPDAGNEEQNGNGTQKETKFISSVGEIAVFKNGTLVDIVDEQIADGSQWIHSSFLPKKLDINVTNEYLNNARVFFYVLEKSVNTDVFFYKNIPMMTAKIDVTMGIDEILTSDGKIIPLNQDIVDQDVKCQIGRKIREETAAVKEYSKNTGLDILELNEMFYFSAYKEYLDYLKNSSTEQFLNDVQISIDVRVEVI